jgi:DNA-binding NarL/FixJ family response regulator
MSPFRILVADDHELMRKAVRALLEGEASQQVIGEAATGAETIGQVASLEPDLVILDLAMPELDGLQVAVRLRQTHPQTQMILLTGNATPALERQALAIGISRCISKTSPPRELIEAVSSLRSNHQGRIGGLLPPSAASEARTGAPASALSKRESDQSPVARGTSPVADNFVGMSLDGSDDPKEQNLPEERKLH